MRTFILGSIAALALTAGSALAQAPLLRTDPSHVEPVPPTGNFFPPADRLTQFPLRPRMIILNAGSPWRSFGRIDKGLSEACAAHRFTEQVNLQYRAIFEQKDVLGVAFGNGVNLVDPDRKAEPDKVYLFRHGDSTNCVVVVLTQQDLKAANNPKAPLAGSTAKPPPKTAPSRQAPAAPPTAKAPSP